MAKASSRRPNAPGLGVCFFLLVLIPVRYTCVEADPVESDADRALAQVEAADILAGAELTEVSGVLEAEETACFVSVIGRGVGVPLNSCPNGTEKDGLLCYTPCRDGYYGVGPVCWQSCPPDLTDIGIFCIKTHFKGCCCTLWGCCGCPEGYNDDGCFCRRSFTKGSYGRGVGLPLICGPGQEQSGALCYPPCPNGYIGVGPVCWDTNSPSEFPVKCNEIVWAVNQSTCNTVNAKFSSAGGASTVCIGTVFGAMATIILWPIAVVVCRATIRDAIEAVNEILDLTGAQTCPSSSALLM